LKPIDVIDLKKKHLARFANETGSIGEGKVVESMNDWVPRPKGEELKVLLTVLEEIGISIKRTSFDAISHPYAEDLDFTDHDVITNAISDMVFIEIKTANQERVKEDFSGFFFALTENEISASEALGEQHRVALFNKRTGVIKMTTIPDIVAKAKSSTWQVSVQL